VTTLATFIAALDSNIVTIALPKISTDFSAGFSLLGWVITGYLLALAALTLQAGKIGDVYGRKKIYLLGFVVFGASSALCGLSNNITELIVFRIVQGASAALLFSVSRPLLLDTFPSSEVSFAIGVNSASWSIGAVIGPVIGGFLVAVDWRLIFYVNVPITVIATLIAIRKIPRNTNDISVRAGVRSINPLSSSLLAFAVAAILLSLSFFNPSYGIVGIVLLVPLVINERRSRDPLINKELRASRGFVYSILAVCALAVGYSGIAFAMSFYFQSVIGLSPELAGVLIAPVSLALAVSSVVAGKIYGKMEHPVNLSLIGAVVTGSGLLLLAYSVSVESSVWIVALALFVAGAGIGLCWTPILTATLRFTRIELAGAANGTFSMFVTIGSAISVAATVAISAFFLPSSLATQVYSGGLINLSSAQTILFKEGIRDAIIVLALVELVSVPILLLVIREQKKVVAVPAGKSRQIALAS
jgi:EmrB/QacA subfamily drug resistance transporter